MASACLFSEFSGSVASAGFLPVSEIGFRASQKATNEARPPVLPPIFLSDLSGTPVMISHIKGRPLLVINFLATWCAPCLKEIPSLVRLVRISKGRVSVIGVLEGEDSRENIRSVLRKEHADFPLLLDRQMKLSSALHVVGLPTSFLVDSRGRIVSRVSGSVNWTDPKVIHYLKSFILSKAGF